MSFYRRKHLRSFAMLLTVCLLLLLFPLQAFAHARTIRVGYFDSPGFLERTEQGYRGYAATYLQELSSTTGWKYQYIEAPRAELPAMLQSGKVDLLCSARPGVDATEGLLFSTLAAGTETGTLQTLPFSQLLYNDFSEFDGLRVGMLYDSDYNDDFTKFAEQNNFTFKPVFFYHTAQLLRAAATGVVDAFIDTDLSGTSYGKTVAHFSVQPFYFAVSSANADIMAQLDTAMADLFVREPNFVTNLHNTYYARQNYSAPVFTPEEQAYLNTKPDLVMDCNFPFGSIVGFDDTDTVREFLALISERSGIRFTYRTDALSSENLSDSPAQKAPDLSACLYDSTIRKNTENDCTQAYFSIPVVMIGMTQKGTAFSTPTVGVPATLPNIHSFLEETCAGYSLLTLNSNSEIVEALENGSVDMVAYTQPGAECLLQDYPDAGLYLMPNSFSCPLSIGVSRTLDPVVLSILNKAISSISPTESSMIWLRRANTTDESSFILWFERNFTAIATLAVLVFLALLSLALFVKRRRTTKLLALAYTDPLTGGKNLACFKQEAHRLLAPLPSRYAVITIDINKFRTINELHGFEYGDRLICAVNEILLRQIDRHELCAHGVADQFVLLCDRTDEDALPLRFAQLFESLEHIDLSAMGLPSMAVSVHCGVCSINTYNHPIEAYIDHASLAARAVKSRYCSEYAVYRHTMQEELNREREMEDRAAQALRLGEFELYLQPKIDLATGEVTGSEALTRWIDSSGRFIRPDEYIPLFEKNGFIEHLDFYVLDRVCALLQNRLKNDLPVTPISINQSRYLFFQKNYLPHVFELLRKYDIPPQLLEFEITETLFVEETDNVRLVLGQLRRKGIRLSLDDFGTGYSSLNTLTNFPVDAIKLDRSFLLQSDSHPKKRVVIEKTIELAKLLGIEVICEGVETTAQVSFLQQIGCDMAQGFLFARPMVADEALDFMDHFDAQSIC